MLKKRGPKRSSLGPTIGVPGSQLIWSVSATRLPASTSGRSEPAALVTNSISQPSSLRVRTAEVITPMP